MAMKHLADLRQLADGFTEANGWPDLPCPACLAGTLAPKDSDAMITEQSWLSRQMYERPDADPDCISGYFHGSLECRLPSCGEIVVVAGEYQVEAGAGPHEYQGEFYGNSYKVQCFVPALSLIREDHAFPQRVNDLIVAASAVLWMDPSSAANRVRAAIEELLTLQGVPKSHISKSRKRIRYTAHKRIELYKERNPRFAEAADLLMAVKWIGNDGSHGGELGIGEVLDGVELLNHALELMYDTNAACLKRRAAEINKRKGIPRKRAAKN
ncbi:DUF4145 domain-containing protein [Streptomyces sp. bgisy130]|uniref:DUF4145 domain-containing protein n=1 Tax=Streptomyces sp. bgisy130 TaxID=3413788 RepID=UPI003F4A7BEF